ncbi:peptidase [Bacillus phage 268TH004]|uniref:Peptidase n=1 Tax=Bacillus phage 268TH004 TaxID=2801523 RepID=A0A7T8C672_9CAUD|nr:peptidase [Bacillus phage 276BB001]QFG05983.1 peptidase [Bacillus phage 280BB001]QQO40411.1 peptidase [Bacillus phage 268TH004]QZA70132.1 peptidase [Bacillus phage 274BB002]
MKIPKYKGNPQLVALWQNKLMRMIEEKELRFDIDINMVGGKITWCPFEPEFRPIVVISDDYLNTEFLNGVMAVLHEIGHYIDVNRYNYNPNIIFGEMGNLHFEISAWEHAFKLARKIGFNEFNTLRDDALFCLRTYYDQMSLWSKLDRNYGFKGEHPSWEEATERINQAHKQAVKAYKSALLRV